MAGEDEIKVLIVDDSDADRETYRRLLVKREGESYAVSEAATGAEGIERLRVERPDCLLLDHRLPDIDGLDLLAKLAAEFGQLPVVFLTGTASDEVAARALAGGAQDYVSKDRVDSDSLTRSLRYAIERNRTAARITTLNQELRDELAARLTELREAHAETMRNERLAALGTLAAGVAHDLNNPLMGVITHIQFGLRRIAEEDGETRDVLEKALKYSRRCADIVKDLLAYSRDSMRQPSTESDLRGNVYQSVEEALADAAGRCEDAGVEVKVNLAPRLPPVRLDNSGMRQVFVNLVSNACDAMRGRDIRCLRIGARQAAGTVVVTIEDSGFGMNEQALAHAFEPFFTTKAQSGTGLGLALCKRIVESIGGKIEVVSTAGAGTTFTLSLPISRPATEPDTQSS